MPETQRAATSLLEEIYDAVPVDHGSAVVSCCALDHPANRRRFTRQRSRRGGARGNSTTVWSRRLGFGSGVAEADNVRSLIVNGNSAMNDPFAFLIAPIRPRHEVYAFLVVFRAMEKPVWIVPLDASIVRKALVRDDASTFLEGNWIFGAVASICIWIVTRSPIPCASSAVSDISAS